MLEKLKVFFSNRTNAVLVGVLVLFLAGGVFAYQKFVASKVEVPLEEIKLSFDPEGPYAILVPRRDGYALNLNIFRVSSYDGISYELSYQASGTTAGEEFGEGPIDRGVQGTLDTKGKKSEYSQEVLFGTCSQGYNTGEAHCVFDKNVENGMLVLKIQKGRKLYKMTTHWRIQKPDVALGVLTSADNQFTYKTTASRQDLTTTGYSITHDLAGAPKLPEGKKVLGKVYALNVPIAKSLPVGDVTIEFLENPPEEAKIYYWQDSANRWEEQDTNAEGSKLFSKGPGAGVYTVLVDDSTK